MNLPCDGASGSTPAGLLLYAVVPVLLGMVSRARFPGLATHELALPALLMDGLPPVVGTIGLAAVFSAEISTADAVLFMLTTSLSQDLYKRFVSPGASDAASCASAVSRPWWPVASARVSPSCHPR